MIRFGGLAAIAGGVLWIGAWVHRGSIAVPPPGSSRPGGETFDALVVVSLTLFMVGMATAWRLQASRMGLVGTVGLALGCFGLAAMASWTLGVVDAYPLFVLGAVGISIGAALYCIASFRIEVLPRSAAVALAIGLLVMPLADAEDRKAFLAVPLGVAWMWLGHALLAYQTGSTATPEHHSP